MTIFTLTKHNPFFNQINDIRAKEDMLDMEREFANLDFSNLFQTNFSLSDRKKFLQKIQPKYEEIEWFNDYKKLLSDFQPLYNAQHFDDFRSYSIKRHIDVKQLVFESRVLFNKDLSEFELSSLFKQAVSLLTDIIKTLTDHQIEIFYYFSQNYEKFTLITLEPFLCNILGFSLFFSLFLPLHKTGAFSLFINKSIPLRNYLLFFTQKILKGFYYFSNRVIANILTKKVVFYSVFAPLGVYACNSILSHAHKYSMLKPFTNSFFINEDYQLKNMDFVKKYATRISFETGLFTGSFFKGLVLGLVLPYQGKYWKN